MKNDYNNNNNENTTVSKTIMTKISGLKPVIASYLTF